MPKLTKAQLGHIHSLLVHEREAGSYYGPKAQHAKRQSDLLDIFACAEAGHLEVRWAPTKSSTAQSHGQARLCLLCEGRGHTGGDGGFEGLTAERPCPRCGGRGYSL